MIAFITDAIAATLVSLGMALGVAAIVSGCVQEPTFVDQCQYCGEYLEDAEAAHAHLAKCSPCRGGCPHCGAHIPDAHSAHRHRPDCPTRHIRHHSEPEPCR